MADEKMTIDKLAEVTQGEFLSMRGEMKQMKTEILGAINDLGLHFSSWQSDWDGRFKDLERRMADVERKVGIHQL